MAGSSSDLSRQSTLPSHRQASWMHCCLPVLSTLFPRLESPGWLVSELKTDSPGRALGLPSMLEPQGHSSKEQIRQLASSSPLGHSAVPLHLDRLKIFCEIAGVLLTIKSIFFFLLSYFTLHFGYISLFCEVIFSIYIHNHFLKNK